ncbi:hypothetical protein [Anabaena sp. UHCC 0451]|uniref:hypothetical protein n=1 Tax=Anabaena sp. UHCC 0451 TaxID=2055235 RepID=UPI003A4C66D4
MTTIKEQLIASIENAPEPILEKTLDYLKTKINTSTIKSSNVSVQDGEPILRGAKAKDLLQFGKVRTLRNVSSLFTIPAPKLNSDLSYRH